MWTGVSWTLAVLPPRCTLTGYQFEAYPLDLLGHESNASVWHRFLGHLRSNVLAADDAG